MKMLAKYYDDFYKFDDADIVLEALQRSNGPLLDLGCGTGRTLETVLKNNFKAIGIDLSQEMIDICRKKLSTYSDNLTLIQSNFLQADIPANSIGTIVIMANTFPMVKTSTERIALLKSCREWLKDGGNIIIVLVNYYKKSDIRSSVIDTIDGELNFTVDWKNEGHKKRIFQLTLTLNNQTEKSIFETAIITPSEFKSELCESELEIEYLYGTFQKEEYQDNSPWQIYCLKKVNR